MERMRRVFERQMARADYEPLQAAPEHENAQDSGHGDGDDSCAFSWTEYSVFALLGVAMLWAW